MSIFSSDDHRIVAALQRAGACVEFDLDGRRLSKDAKAGFLHCRQCGEDGAVKTAR